MELTPVKQKFILHWGEMGTRWGVNRTVAQIHALLFMSDTPLHAELISETLGVARSNVSNSLKELQGWGLIKTVPVLGDRRDYFETSKDVWELFYIIIEERKKREFDPTLQVLRECVQESAANSEDPALGRIQEVLQFMETLTSWQEEMRQLPPKTLINLLSMGTKIQKFLRKKNNA